MLYTEDRVSNPSLLIEGLHVACRPAERNHSFVTTYHRSVTSSQKSMIIEKHTLQASERLLTLNSVTDLPDLIGRVSDSYAKKCGTFLTVKCYVSTGGDRQSLNRGKFCWFLLIWRHFQLL